MRQVAEEEQHACTGCMFDHLWDCTDFNCAFVGKCMGKIFKPDPGDDAEELWIAQKARNRLRGDQ